MIWGFCGGGGVEVGVGNVGDGMDFDHKQINPDYNSTNLQSQP